MVYYSMLTYTHIPKYARIFLDSFFVLKAELEVTNYRDGYRYRRPTYYNFSNKISELLL